MANKLGRYIAQEILEVDRLIEQRQAHDTAFDDLYQKVAETPQEPPQDTEIDDTATMEDLYEKSAEIALETLSELCFNYLLLSVPQVSKEDLLTETLTNGLVHLKDIGASYGTVVFDKVYKGLVKAMGITVRALAKGLLKIQDAVKTYQTRHEQLKSTIADAYKVLDALGDKETPKDIIADHRTFATLAIDNQVDLSLNLTRIKALNTTYYAKFAQVTSATLTQILRIIEQVIHQTQPSTHIRLPVPNGFKKQWVPGYTSGSESTDTWVYKEVLPGDSLLLAYWPKDLLDDTVYLEGLRSSKIFFGVTNVTYDHNTQMPVLPLAEIRLHLQALETIVDFANLQVAVFEKIEKERKRINPALSLYLHTLSQQKEKVSIADTAIIELNAILKALDSTYINGAIQVQEYTARQVGEHLALIQTHLTYYT